MNPIIRTGTGVTDDLTTRIVLASNSPQFTGDGLVYNSIEITYFGSTNNIQTVTYRLDGTGVRGLTFEYIGSTSVNNAKLSKITIIPADQILGDDPGMLDPGFGFGPGGGIIPA